MVSRESYEAVLQAIEERRKDSAFMERLARSIEANRAILDALAPVDGGDLSEPSRNAEGRGR